MTALRCVPYNPSSRRAPTAAVQSPRPADRYGHSSAPFASPDAVRHLGVGFREPVDGHFVGNDSQPAAAVHGHDTRPDRACRRRRTALCRDKRRAAKIPVGRLTAVGLQSRIARSKRLLNRFMELFDGRILGEVGDGSRFSHDLFDLPVIVHRKADH